MKFAHLGDCHLGGWRQPELRELNFKSFQQAVEKCINENVEFVIITGDLFDSAYPPIETLKGAFHEFRKLKENLIPVFIIAGSHDYSASGKTFLDVLEKSGFCKNVAVFEEREGKIILEPTIHQNIAIYGYPGRKSGLEVEDISRIKIQDSPGLFKILMLHTAIRDALGNLPVEAVDEKTLPKCDYLALSHLHIDYARENRAYSGPTFPNSLPELAELKHGMFRIFENGKIRKEILKTKNVETFDITISDATNATNHILEVVKGKNLEDKIVILRLQGSLERGKLSDIDFQKIESYLKNQRVFLILKSTTKIHLAEPDFKIDLQDSVSLEDQIIKNFEQNNYSKFNEFIPSLLQILQIEKADEEKSLIFEERLFSETRRILKI